LNTVAFAAALLHEISIVNMVSPVANPPTTVFMQMPEATPLESKVGLVEVPRLELTQAPAAGTVVEFTNRASARGKVTPGGALGIPPAPVCGGTDEKDPRVKEPRESAVTEARIAAPMPRTMNQGRRLARGVGGGARIRR